jgi:predicted dehydrogenase
MSASDQIKFAVVGAGGFAHFAVSEFVKNDQVKFVGVFDSIAENCERFKTLSNLVKVYASEKELLNDKEVDLVYIATPPFLHYTQSRAALMAGKHVICEKPAALKVSEAEELLKLSEERELLYVVNLMQRYNPLYDAVKTLIEKNVLGNFLRGYFENYASDERLQENHWFWDERKSGGIFIEHGVHFFDLFTGWLGHGEMIASQKIRRRGYNLVDKVHATVLFKGGLVNFYHGFDQPKVLDRQEMRLQFERGEITLYEWVPTQLIMNAICSTGEFNALREIFPKASITVREQNSTPRKARGNFNAISYHTKLTLDTGARVNKETVYRDLLSAMLLDQIQWLRSREHVRKISGDNAVSSLALADNADYLSTMIEVR